MPEVTMLDLPNIGRVVLQNRDKMKRADRRMFQKPAGAKSAETPPPPTTCDWSKGDAIKFPILGNDQVGDCYYAAILHMVQAFVGQYATPPQFDVSKVIARYEQLSGGDNGLSDSDVYPEWKRGILGPDGPHKIRDSLIVNTMDVSTLHLAIWAFNGCLLTVSLPVGWANNASPGAVWTTGAGGSVGGHAIILTGFDEKYLKLRTWGIAPAINLTVPGMLENDPEVIVVFSEEMFDPKTKLTAAGMTWDQAKAVWMAHGGADVGAAPWVTPPTPVPPGPDPVPPEPQPVPDPVGTITIPDKTVTTYISLLGRRPITFTIPGGTYTVKWDGVAGEPVLAFDWEQALFELVLLWLQNRKK